MAELELSVLGRQYLDQRISEKKAMAKQVRAWTSQRNKARTSVNWRFTTKDVRIRSRKLYPSIEP